MRRKKKKIGGRIRQTERERKKKREWKIVMKREGHTWSRLPWLFCAGIIMEFIWLQVSHWKTWVFISAQPNASITVALNFVMRVCNKNLHHVRPIHLVWRSAVQSDTFSWFVISQSIPRKESNFWGVFSHISAMALGTALPVSHHSTVSIQTEKPKGSTWRFAHTPTVTRGWTLLVFSVISEQRLDGLCWRCLED